LSAKLAKSHGVVVLEDIATANLMRNHHLAQAIGDQGWGELSCQLHYKTTRAGGTLVVADRWRPSRKTCSACGAVKPRLPLGRVHLPLRRMRPGHQRRRKPRRLG
jgi:putative transposase